MNLQLCGKKFRIFHLVVVLLCSSAIISFKMFVDTMLDSSANREVTLKDEFVQFDHNLSNTPTLIHPTSWHQKSKKKSIAIQHFSVGQLQVNLEYVKAHMQTNSRSGGFGAGCKIPPGGFKSWTRGTITKLTPIIHANCTLLFKGGDELEVAHVQLASYTWPVKEHALKFAKWVETHSCTDFKDELEGNLYTTKDEIDFPLAFAMLIHDSTFQVFRLLKVIYRPHNIYCIHYDNRSSEDMKLLVNKLAMCFDNIIIPDNFIPVQWGHHSLMDAQMKCFRELLRNRDKYPWRYVITLCGKELPLRTNNEIVQLLKQLKGNSAVRAFPVPKWEQKRYQTKWTVKSNTWIAPTKEDAGPVPYNLTVYKSMIYFALSPEFVNYTLNDEIAIALSEFLKDALIPEENFYSTLFMIPGMSDRVCNCAHVHMILCYCQYNIILP